MCYYVGPERPHGFHMSFNLQDLRIGVVGLGYVGLPLAVEFGKKFPTVGFDLKPTRIAALAAGNDKTLEVDREELELATRLSYTSDPEDLRGCNFYIVTVPTPLGPNNRPELAPLKGASETLGTVINRGDIVVYESTVYPGATEEFCVPILESRS